MNPTNDPALRSFLPVGPESHFPIQNLPYGVFRRKSGGEPTIGVAISDQVLDLAVLEKQGLLDTPTLRGKRVFQEPVLNAFLALGRPAWREARAAISRLLSDAEPTLRDNGPLRDRALVPAAEIEMLLPVRIGDYTDFYSSREHATNVGRMVRGPENPLLPNWLYLPVAYHGRASSVVVSGTDPRRPLGQAKPANADGPTFGPCRMLDFELEMGFFIGPGNALGRPVPIAEAPEQIFGLVLVNDWSARDIQTWEYQPLGPFLSKSLCTSISPWVVPLEALEPFRVPGPVQDPEPFPYLRSPGNWSLDVHLEVYLQAAGADRPQRISASNLRHMYWNICQQLAHHTSNGCNLRPGDLLATGTISGPTPDSSGSLLELTWKGTRPLTLPGGATRTFLEDDDRITLTGWCQGQGYRVGFGEVTGRVLPAEAAEGDAWDKGTEDVQG